MTLTLTYEFDLDWVKGTAMPNI